MDEEIIKDFPNLEKDIEKAEKEYKKGKCSTLGEALEEDFDDY